MVWFLIIFSEKPKYAREMHGIIHSLNGGKLTFSLFAIIIHPEFSHFRDKKAASVWLSDRSEMIGGGIVFV